MGRTTKASAKPLGTQPPPYDWTPLLLRFLLVFGIGLLAQAEAFVAWAEGYPRINLGPLGGELPLGNLPLAEQPFAVVAAMVQLILVPPGWYGLVGGTLGMVVLMVMGHLWAAMRIVHHTTSLRGAARAYVRVRLPQTGLRTPEGSGVDLLWSLYDVIPVDPQVYLVLLLSARADNATDVGIQVVGKTPRQVAQCVATIRDIVRGSYSEAVVEPIAIQPTRDAPIVTDPLVAELQLGRIALGRTYRLALPPAFPLRLYSEQKQTDLMGSLVAGVQPRQGVAYGEVQLVLQPQPQLSRRLTMGWRASVLRRYLRLTAKQEHALAPDTKALESKLHAPAYDVTVRHVVVAHTSATCAKADDELMEMQRILGQYTARSGGRVQRLVPSGHSKVEVPSGAPSSGQMLQSWGWGGFLTGFIGLISILVLSLPMLVSILIALLSGLVLVYMLQRQSGILSHIRVQQLSTRMPQLRPPDPLLWPLRLWASPAILGPDELSGLYHLPTPSLGSMVRWLPNRYLSTPEAAFIGNATDRIMIGWGWHADGTLAPVGMPLRVFPQILHLTAGMGAGKTRFLVNLIRQFFPHGGFIFDGKGDDAQGSLVSILRRHIPLDLEPQLVLLDILHVTWPIGLNLLAGVDITKPGGKDLAVGQMKAVFARFDPNWERSVGIQEFADNAVLLVVEGAAHPTIAHVLQVIIDDGYREEVLQRCTNEEVVFFWTVTYPAMGESQKNSREAFIRRIRKLLTSELTRHLVSQPQPALDLLAAIESKKIILVPLPDMALGDLSGAVGMLFLQAFVRAAMRRPGDATTRPVFPFVADEFQQMLSTGNDDDVKTIVTRLRSFAIGGVYAHQTLSQLGEVEQEVRINAGSRLILQTTPPDAGTYAKQYPGSGLTEQDIARQDPSEHQYAKLLVDPNPFSIKPLLWPAVEPPAVPAYHGPHWQTCIPLQSPTPQFDRLICDLVYGERPHAQVLVNDLAASAESRWQALLERWEVLRWYHRQYIIDHPGCVALPARPAHYDQVSPEEQARIDRQRRVDQQFERQQWLSDLGYGAGMPLLLRQVAYARTRRPVDPTVVPVSSAKMNGGTRTTKGGATATEQEPPPPTNFSDADRPSTEADVLMPFNDEHLLED